jgi:hypothetical protein
VCVFVFCGNNLGMNIMTLLGIVTACFKSLPDDCVPQHMEYNCKYTE